ncbi:hypothetical protein [Rummeliibacillus pycnus]|nr:hypothetical protein [Rummeliibacillus pycnus]
MRLPALQKVESVHKNLITQILCKIVGRKVAKIDRQKKRYYPVPSRK